MHAQSVPVNGRLMFLTTKFFRRVIEVTSRWLDHTSIIDETEKRTSPIKLEKTRQKKKTMNTNATQINLISLPECANESINGPFSEQRNDISDMEIACVLSHLPMSNFEFARVQKLTDLRNSTEIERHDKQSCRDFGCFYTLIYEGIQRKNKQSEVQASLLRCYTLQNSPDSALRAVYEKGLGPAT